MPETGHETPEAMRFVKLAEEERDALVETLLVHARERVDEVDTRVREQRREGSHDALI